MAVQATNRLARGEDRIDDLLGEDAGEESADCSAGAMYAERIERVVVTEYSFDLSHHEVAERTGDESDNERRHRADETCRGSDCNKSGDSTGDRAESAGFAVLEPFRNAPAQSRSGCANVRCDECAGSERACGKRAACVKSEPAYPQHARADETEDKAVRGHGLFGETCTLAHVKRANEGRNAGRNVHH